MSILRSKVSAWPCSSNAITITAAPERLTSCACRRNSSSPFFKLIEFTTALPCTHLRPASITLHFELSIIIGTRAMSGSLPIKFKKRAMAASESIIPSSILTSIMFAPPWTCWRATVSAPSKSSPRINFENFGEPVMFVRSPITAKPNSDVILSGSRPESCNTSLLVRPGISRGGQPRTAFAISRMCSGVVPQHPPTRLSQPFFAHFCNFGASDFGVSGKPVSESGSGRPAFGYALI